MQRYPPTSDRSLTVFSAADHLLIEWASEVSAPDTTTAVYHDRFGAVALSVPDGVVFFSTFHSQEEALARNAGQRKIPIRTVLDKAPEFIDRALIRIPKSLDLFEFYLQHVVRHASPGTRIAAGFMTRHFTPRLLEIAQRYAGKVSQTKAKKKARLLLLADLKDGGGAQVKSLRVKYGDKQYEQLPGVFAANGVDMATAFLLDNWPSVSLPTTICDLACGSGIIGDQLLSRYPGSTLTALDDSVLAVASARINLEPLRSRVYYAHTLDDIDGNSQDLIVTNPPFHFGFEHNIDVSLGLFRQAREKLRPGGALIVVANRHLNYATHLTKWFRQVDTVAENEKFVVYVCRSDA
ncbi:class I SAM-dependent methyltransferase [Lewinella sp. IMCC34191]|uniref:class I SAM-dependent methyltransferase n=1 Tax=Lewinella sp. IMCC34191 TaxID=2259172 RepID=UPI000E275A61|nr:methyltransferase [Lewinella sp. IMCC34191]